MQQASSAADLSQEQHLNAADQHHLAHLNPHQQLDHFNNQLQQHYQQQQQQQQHHLQQHNQHQQNQHHQRVNSTPLMAAHLQDPAMSSHFHHSHHLQVHSPGVSQQVQQQQQQQSPSTSTSSYLPHLQQDHQAQQQQQQQQQMQMQYHQQHHELHPQHHQFYQHQLAASPAVGQFHHAHHHLYQLHQQHFGHHHYGAATSEAAVAAGEHHLLEVASAVSGYSQAEVPTLQPQQHHQEQQQQQQQHNLNHHHHIQHLNQEQHLMSSSVRQTNSPSDSEDQLGDADASVTATNGLPETSNSPYLTVSGHLESARCSSNQQAREQQVEPTYLEPCGAAGGASVAVSSGHQKGADQPRQRSQRQARHQRQRQQQQNQHLQQQHQHQQPAVDNSINEAATYKDADIEHTSTHIVVTNMDTGGHVKLTNEELTCFSVRQLNKIVAGFPRLTVTKLKQRRRTLKNRGYAQNCRHKRLDQKNRLERQNEELRLENRQLREQQKELREQSYNLNRIIKELRQRVFQCSHELSELRQQHQLQPPLQIAKSEPQVEAEAQPQAQPQQHLQQERHLIQRLEIR